MHPEAFQLTDALTAAWTARPREVAADGTVLARRVSRPADLDIAKIGLTFLLESFLLDDLPEVEIALEMALLLGPLVDSLLVLVLTRLTLTHLESFVVVQLGHLVGILKEILLKISQLLLNHRTALVLVDLSHSCCEAFVPATVTGLGNGARHYL